MTQINWRQVLPTDLSEYGALIDSAFALTDPLHYLADFPVWDPSLLNQKNRYQLGGWSGGELVATASLRLSNYQVESGKAFKLGLIGAVAAKAGFQGKGLGSKLLESLITEGESRDVDAFVLWGSESGLYSKNGFSFAGLQIRSSFDRLKIEGDILEGFEVRSGWSEEIVRHLIARENGLLYQESDGIWLERHTGVEWRTLWWEGKCIAYCGWNRGIDLANLIHELGGTEIGIRTLLDYISKRYTFLEVLHHPGLSKTGISSSAESEHLAQIRITGKTNPIRDVIDELWFSGMDSC